MRKVVFLDRDGVINDDTGHYYIYKKEDFKLNEGVLESLRLIRNNGYEVVVITNQGGIARGTYLKDDVQLVHDYMLELFAEIDVNPLAVYFCPHHDKVEKCLCRKPQGLMLTKAINRFGIDIEASFMIGDNLKDVEAANNAGIRGFKIQTNATMLPLLEEIFNG